MAELVLDGLEISTRGAGEAGRAMPEMGELRVAAGGVCGQRAAGGSPIVSRRD
ncbi:hypothetical protein [Dactylosporangium salmoneum]|uniref:hypothetical protein n=1 Tax=Dactylosporangium salmoneum TaxID=53361 RepID=UPI0031DF7BC6